MTASVYLAVGILGATVMPHAIFLGSHLATQDRISRGPDKLSRIDSTFSIDSDLTAARPPFLPALHSMGRETEESGRTIDLDEDYLEMKSLDLHGDGPFVAVAV